MLRQKFHFNKKKFFLNVSRENFFFHFLFFKFKKTVNLKFDTIIIYVKKARYLLRIAFIIRCHGIFKEINEKIFYIFIYLYGIF